MKKEIENRDDLYKLASKFYDKFISRYNNKLLF